MIYGLVQTARLSVCVDYYRLLAASVKRRPGTPPLQSLQISDVNCQHRPALQCYYLEDTHRRNAPSTSIQSLV